MKKKVKSYKKFSMKKIWKEFDAWFKIEDADAIGAVSWNRQKNKLTKLVTKAVKESRNG